MDIFIRKLREQDAEELFQFELQNRTFFEKMVPSRGEEYYEYETFCLRHQELLVEQESEKSSFFLILNNSNQIVGRINLVDIDPVIGIAHIGYRVGEGFTRKGIASIALGLLLETASTYGLKKLHAKTTLENRASQKVLVKSGFYPVLFENERDQGEFVHYIFEY
jgi:ribosomal-protein-alanine N-acetyltransferase